MIRLRGIFLLLLITAWQPVLAADCRECHHCDQPTVKNPCLPECLRDLHEPDWGDFQQLHSPEQITLDQLVDKYEPVIFDHKTHAEMSGMGGASCSLCHHENELHEIGCCCDCHPATIGPGDIGVTDLKTAYHRQCMFCHRDWSHETDCEVCHASRGTSIYAAETPLPLDETHSFAHRNMPERVLFETEHRAGPYVTFDHQTHTEHELNCRECHSQDACSACHNGHAPTGNGHLHNFSNRSTCSQCHEVGQCSVCHAREQYREFSHDFTGWPLGDYHAQVGCDRCHGDRKIHNSMPRECDGCHNLWEDEHFDHASMVKVDLGEEHDGMDCSDCHQDAGYTSPPVCSDCHDDEREGDLLR